MRILKAGRAVPATLELRPRLLGRVEGYGDHIVVLHNDIERVLEPSGLAPSKLLALLARLDGTDTLASLVGQLPELSETDIYVFIEQLDKDGLIDDASIPVARSGLDVALELEDLVDELCARFLFHNIFWKKCLRARRAKDLPRSVIVGLVIENYHFLFRESYFDAPVLSYVPNTSVRLTMNRFFAEEFGHDEILLQALGTVGITRADLADAMPLPATMSLCNALAYWAHNDPLFFFTTLGLLEGQGLKHDSFIETCERVGIDESFIRPLRIHSDINIRGGHGSLTRSIFSDIRAVDVATVLRLRAQTHLFVELYDAFYANVWQYYSTAPTLLRRVSEI